MSLKALRDTLAANGCNKADQVIALITACIEDGITAGPEVLSTVSALGFNERYVGIQLSTNASPNPERSLWVRTAEGPYQLHP
jgi:hypothetical protein